MPKGKHHPITVSGVEYPSVTDAAEAYGLPMDVVYRRIFKLGWTPEMALKTPKKQRNKPLSVGGQEFVSQRRAADAMGIDPVTFHGRLSRGMSPQDAADVDFMPLSRGGKGN